MNKQLIKVLLWLGFGVLMLLVVFLLMITKVDYASDIPVERPEATEQNSDIYPLLKGVDIANLKDAFPYENYLNTAEWKHVSGLQRTLAALDSINPNQEMMNQEVLSIALTEKLEARINNVFKTYNPDSLIRMMQWAEKFNYYADIDEKHNILFEVIYNYWFNFVSNELREKYEKDNSLKYNYKFRYIADRLREQQFSTPIRGTYFEKTINKLLQKNWTYLFNKFWYTTSIYYKLVVLLIFIFIIFPYIYLLKSLKK